MTSTDTTTTASSPIRVPAQVYLLAAVIFCLGTSEFMIAGILEPISADLDISIPQAGLLITGFAIGMIVGAPAMALLTLKLPRKATMIITIIAFSALHILAGLVGGLTVSNLVGVPLGTWVGTQYGWRATFWAVAVVTALAAVLIAVTTRSTKEERAEAELHLPTLLRAELAAFSGPRIWLALGTTALFQASVFAAFSYFSPLLTQVAGLSPQLVPAVLAAFGIGSFIGVVVGGRLADRSIFGNIVGSLAALALSLLALWFVADNAWVTVVMIVLVGASGFSIAGALNARVFQIATQAPTLAASVNTSAFNVGCCRARARRGGHRPRVGLQGAGPRRDRSRPGRSGPRLGGHSPRALLAQLRKQPYQPQRRRDADEDRRLRLRIRLITPGRSFLLRRLPPTSGCSPRAAPEVGPS